MTKTNQLTTFFLLTILCSGCVYTPIDIPALPEIKEQPVCPKLEQVSCPKLDMPDPIPKNVFINIKDGKAINLDSGGEQLIRNYAATRKAIKRSLQINLDQ